MRPNPYPGRHNQAAFTLVELLLALVITSLSLTAIYGVFHTSLRAYRDTSEDLRMSFESGFLSDAITRDLRGAVLVQAEGIACFRGDSERMEFFTAAAPPGGGAWPMRHVSYVFEKSPEDEYGVLSCDVRPYAGETALRPDSSSRVVLDRLAALRFRYYANNRWQDEWTQQGLPQAVEISAEIAGDDRENMGTLRTAADLPCFVTGRH